MYTRPGSWVGAQTTMSEWELLGETSVVSPSGDTYAKIPLGSITPVSLVEEERQVRIFIGTEDGW